MATVAIHANERWNRTGVMVSADRTYRLSATGEWVDWFIRHGPAGDPSDSLYMRWFERARRMPHANWFALIGALDADMSTAFVIGEECTWTPSRSGELTCFANDVPGFYWNNKGSVALTVA